jgi:hypothetical protein
MEKDPLVPFEIARQRIAMACMLACSVDLDGFLAVTEQASSPQALLSGFGPAQVEGWAEWAELARALRAVRETTSGRRMAANEEALRRADRMIADFLEEERLSERVAP